MNRFIGRERELFELNELLKKKSASLVVIRGRRRIGKSRLAEEFGKSFDAAYTLVGLAPLPGITATQQRAEFARQLRESRIPHFGGDDWGDLFASLGYHAREGRVLVVLDEITWMGSKDVSFLAKLKTAWDLHFKKNPRLVLILSGSNSHWIEKNILSSTGFLGRISYRLLLKELTLSECDEFWGGAQVSAYEKFKLLAVVGGVPRYLEEIRPELSAEENLKRLCFRAEGLLLHEFNEIFSDLFSGRSQQYRKIVCALADGRATVDGVAARLKREKGGDLTEALQDLCEAGFVQRDSSWHIRDSRQGRLTQYRLSDNYVRFYLKYIEPYRNRILDNTMKDLPAGWLTIMGYQFENLVTRNRERLFNLLSIAPEEVLWASPYFQKGTQRYSECQLDLLIQTRFQSLYACEVKFERREVGPKVIREMQERVNRLKTPRGFSVRPILIHVNGVSDSVLDSDYFSHIVDFSELLKD